jgi:hypothetical protein
MSVRSLSGDKCVVLEILGIFLVSALFEFSEPINRDVSCFIYSAREYLFHHKIPYQDIIDVNPPLSTWLFMPTVAASHYLSLSSDTMVLACIGEIYLLLILSIMSLWLVLKNGDFPLSKRHRHIFIVLFLFVATLGCATSFGQRDHLILVFILPELLLACAAISSEANVSRSGNLQRIGCGILAWAAIAMKPHYIIALLLPETYVWFRCRSIKACFRPETITILVLSVIYTLIIIICYPGIFSVSGNAAIQFYHELSVLTARRELKDVALLSALFMLRFVFHVFGKPGPYDALLIGVVGTYLAYLAQKMGLPYQKISFEGLSVAWVMLAMPSLWPFNTNPQASYACAKFCEKYKIRYSIASMGIVSISFFISTLILQNEILRSGSAGLSLLGIEQTVPAETSNKTRLLLQRYAQHKPVLFLSTSLLAFPAVVYEDVEVASRWGYLWPLPKELKLPVEQRGMLAKTLAEDIARDKPSLIFVDTGSIQLYLPFMFDYIAYFSQWPEFRKQWQRYEKIPAEPDVDVGAYTLFRRKS